MCRLLATVAMGANLLTPWALGLGLPVPLGLHLVLHMVLAARLAFLQAPALCRAQSLAVSWLLHAGLNVLPRSLVVGSSCVFAGAKAAVPRVGYSS